MPCFEVDGLPPNKAGGSGKSMWSNEQQARRLIALRKKALEVVKSPYTEEEDVRLRLKIHVGIPGWDTLGAEDRRKALKLVGDLDNLVAGVCDGLMEAHKNTPRTSFHCSFGDSTNSVYPRKSIAFKDDSQITKIHAERVVSAGHHAWYRVEMARA